MSILLSFDEIKKLYHLSNSRRHSNSNYFQFQKYQGELLIKYLDLKKIEYQNDLILDLGCAFGGYSQALFEKGCNVIGVDINAFQSFGDAQYINANAVQLPFADGQFDIIICASLIEHVPNADVLLKEIFRVLKKKGVLYLGFPPFFSPIGGHEFSPFHLLGEKFAIKFISWKLRKQHNKRNCFLSYANAYGNWGLYPLTIAGVKNLLNKFQVSWIDICTRYSPLNFSAIPILGEFLTWHVIYLVKKE